MTTLADFKRWSFRQKLRNPFAGLEFCRKTNTIGTYVALSRHWPHLLCWSWAFYVTKGRRLWRRWGWKNNGGFQIGFETPLGGAFLIRQSYDYMGRGDSAPRVDWDAERARRNKEVK